MERSRFIDTRNASFNERIDREGFKGFGQLIAAYLDRYVRHRTVMSLWLWSVVDQVDENGEGSEGGRGRVGRRQISADRICISNEARSYRSASPPPGDPRFRPE